MFKINRKVVEALEALGWNVSEYDTYYEFENWSPAGEDLVETYDKDRDIIEWAGDLVDNFDVDDHVAMWIEAKQNGMGGVPSIRCLLNDAEKIEQMYNEVYDAIIDNATEDDEDEEEDED